MSIAFESLFVFDSVFCRGGLGYMDVAEAREMVNKNAGHCLSLFGGVAGAKGIVSWNGGDKLVHGHTIAWYRGRSNVSVVVGVAPAGLGLFAVLTAGADRVICLLENGRQNSFLRGLLEDVEKDMSKT